MTTLCATYDQVPGSVKYWRTDRVVTSGPRTNAARTTTTTNPGQIRAKRFTEYGTARGDRFQLMVMRKPLMTKKVATASAPNVSPYSPRKVTTGSG